MLPKVPNYLKNVAKSSVYIAANTIKDTEEFSSIKDFTETNADVIKSTYDMIRSKNKFKRITQGIKQSKVFELTDKTLSNALHALKTGDFYNQRRAMDADEAQMKAMGMDLSMDMDMDYGFDSDSKPAPNPVVTSVEQASKANAETVSNAILTSTKITTTMTKESQALAQFNFLKLDRTMADGFSNISQGLSALNQFNTEAMHTHLENSRKYYETTTNALNQQTAMMKEMLEMHRAEYNAIQEKEERRSKTKYLQDIMNMNGIPNLKAYFEKVQDNAWDELSNASMGMLSKDTLKMVGGGLEGFAANPWQYIIGSLMRSMVMGSNGKKAMRSFNTTLGGIFPNMIARLKDLSEHSENPMYKVIGNIFGIESKHKTSISRQATDKGLRRFDGITYKTINTIIPSQLAQIISLMSGQPAKIFDHDYGEFRSVKDIHNDLKEDKSRNIRYAFSDLDSIFRRRMDRAGYNYDTERGKAAFEDSISQFKQLVYNTNGAALNYSAARLAEKGINPEHAKMIKKHLRSNQLTDKERGYIMSMANNIYQARGDINDRIERINNESQSAIKDAHSGLFSLENTNEGRRGSGLFNSIDRYNKSAIDYLRDISVATQNIYVNGIPIEGLLSRGLEQGVGSERLRRSTSRRRERRRRLRQIRGAVNRRRRRTKTADQIYDQETEEQRAEREARESRTLHDEDYNLDTESPDFNFSFQKEIDDDAENPNNRDRKSWIDLDPEVEEVFKSKGVMAALKSSKNLGQKLGVLTRGVQEIVQSPSTLFTSAIVNADKYVYDLFFQDSDKVDSNGKPITGFMDLLVFKTEKAFDKINSVIDEHLLQPLQRMLGGKTVTQWAMDKVGLNEAWQLFKDKYGYSIRDATGQAGSAIGGLIHNAFKWHRDDEPDDIDGHAEGIKLVTKTGLTALSGGELVIPSTMNPYNPNRKNASISKDLKAEDKVKKQFINAMHGGDSIHNYANGGGIDEDEANDALAQMRVLHGSTFHRKVIVHNTPDSNGMYTVLSDGELFKIDQTQYDKLKDKNLVDASKSKSTVDMNISRNRLRNPDANGNLEDYTLNTLEGEEILHLSEDQYTKQRKKYRRELKHRFKDTLLGNVTQTVNETITSLFYGEGKDAKRKYHQKLDQLDKKINDNLPAGIKGGIYGAIAGTLGFGSPMIGAMIGAAGNVLLNQQKYSEMIFGKEVTDSKGKKRRVGGWISPEIQEKVGKYIPDLKRFGTLGTLAGIISPWFGPLGGAMIGGSIAILKNNHSFMNVMFGKDSDKNSGILSKNRRNIIKKALPKMGVGTAAAYILPTLLGVPGLGLMGSAVVGSAASIIGTSEKFKTLMFGAKYRGVGKRNGGLMGLINKGIVKPILGTTKLMAKMMKDLLVDELFKPLRDTFRPIKDLTVYLTKQLGRMGKFFFKTLPIDYILKPINNAMKDFILNPIKNRLKSIFGKFAAPLYSRVKDFGKSLWDKKKYLNPLRATAKLGRFVTYQQALRGNSKVDLKTRLNLFREFGQGAETDNKYMLLDQLISSGKMDSKQLEDMIKGVKDVGTIQDIGKQEYNKRLSKMRKFISNTNGANGVQTRADGKLLTTTREILIKEIEHEVANGGEIHPDRIMELGDKYLKSTMNDEQRKAFYSELFEHAHGLTQARRATMDSRLANPIIQKFKGMGFDLTKKDEREKLLKNLKSSRGEKVNIDTLNGSDEEIAKINEDASNKFNLERVEEFATGLQPTNQILERILEVLGKQYGEDEDTQGIIDRRFAAGRVDMANKLANFTNGDVVKSYRELQNASPVLRSLLFGGDKEASKFQEMIFNAANDETLKKRINYNTLDEMANNKSLSNNSDRKRYLQLLSLGVPKNIDMYKILKGGDKYLENLKTLNEAHRDAGVPIPQEEDLFMYIIKDKDALGNYIQACEESGYDIHSLNVFKAYLNAKDTTKLDNIEGHAFGGLIGSLAGSFLGNSGGNNSNNSSSSSDSKVSTVSKGEAIVSKDAVEKLSAHDGEAPQAVVGKYGAKIENITQPKELLDTNGLKTVKAANGSTMISQDADTQKELRAREAKAEVESENNVALKGIDVNTAEIANALGAGPKKAKKSTWLDKLLDFLAPIGMTIAAILEALENLIPKIHMPETPSGVAKTAIEGARGAKAGYRAAKKARADTEAKNRGFKSAAHEAEYKSKLHDFEIAKENYEKRVQAWVDAPEGSNEQGLREIGAKKAEQEYLAAKKAFEAMDGPVVKDMTDEMAKTGFKKYLTGAGRIGKNLAKGFVRGNLAANLIYKGGKGIYKVGKSLFGSHFSLIGDEFKTVASGTRTAAAVADKVFGHPGAKIKAGYDMAKAGAKAKLSTAKTAITEGYKSAVDHLGSAKAQTKGAIQAVVERLKETFKPTLEKIFNVLPADKKADKTFLSKFMGVMEKMFDRLPKVFGEHPKLLAKAAAKVGVRLAGGIFSVATSFLFNAAWDTTQVMRHPGRILGIKDSQCGIEEYALAEILCILGEFLCIGPYITVAIVLGWLAPLFGIGKKITSERAALEKEAKEAGMSVTEYQEKKLGMTFAEDIVMDKVHRGFNAAWDKTKKVAGSIWDDIKAIGSNIADAFSIIFKTTATLGEATYNGDLSAFMSVKSTDVGATKGTFGNIMTKIFIAAEQTVLTPIIGITSVVRLVKDHITEITSTLGDSITASGTGLSQLSEAVWDGNLSAFMSVDAKSAGSKTTVGTYLTSAILGSAQAILSVPMGVTTVIRGIKDALEGKLDLSLPSKDDFLYYATADSFDGYWDRGPKIDPKKPLSGVGYLVNKIAQLFYSIPTAFHMLINNNLFSKALETIGGFVSKIMGGSSTVPTSSGTAPTSNPPGGGDNTPGKPGDDKDASLSQKVINKGKEAVAGATKFIKSTGKTIMSALGSGNESKYGTGKFYSQLDPMIKNDRFNKPGDTEYQTVGDSACGPISAANALSALYPSYGKGKNSKPNPGKSGDSLPIALIDKAMQYKETNGGTEYNFFRNVLPQYGAKSTDISNQDIPQMLASGQPVIMMGTDKNAGANTPYGPNPHYITATGIDSNGNVTVQDPESRVPNQSYKLSKLEPHTTKAFAVSKTGMGRYGVGNTHTSYARFKRPSHTPKYGKGNRYGKGTDVPEYIWNWLKGKGLGAIQIAAIMGNIQAESTFDPNADNHNGAYGLIQWYAGRREALKSWCSSHGMAYNSLDGQLNFFWHEVTEVKPYTTYLNNLMHMTNLDEATSYWCDHYESPGDGSNPKRIAFARKIFQTQGKGIAFAGSYSGSNGGSMPQQKPQGLLDQLLSPITSEMNSMYAPLMQQLTSGLDSVLGNSKEGQLAQKLFGSSFSLGGNTAGGMAGMTGGAMAAGGALQNIGSGGKAQEGSGQAYELANLPGAVVTSPYGKDRGSYHHGGVDLGIDLGTKIPSPVTGTIADAGFQAGGYGNFIQVEDARGNYHLFGHLSRILASKGQSVKKGDIIALSGSTGHSTGPHTHYEIDPPSNFAALSRGEHFNPATYSVAGLGSGNKSKLLKMPSVKDIKPRHFGTGSNNEQKIKYGRGTYIQQTVESVSHEAANKSRTQQALTKAANAIKESASKTGKGTGETVNSIMVKYLKIIASNTGLLTQVIALLQSKGVDTKAITEAANKNQSDIQKIASVMNSVSSSGAFNAHTNSLLENTSDLIGLLATMAEH